MTDELTVDRRENERCIIELHDKFCIKLTKESVYSADLVVNDESFKVIVDSVFFAMEELDIPGYLFITVLPGSLIATGPNPDDCGLGLYNEGMQHITIAGVQHEEFPGTPQDWLAELSITTIHEVIHYKQDLDGTLGKDGYEEAADEMSVKMSKLVI